MIVGEQVVAGLPAMGIDDFRLIELGNETRQESLRFRDTELSVIVEDVEIERVELYAFLVERFGEADDRLAGRRMPVDQALADRTAIVGLLFGLIGDFDPLPGRPVVQGRTSITPAVLQKSVSPPLPGSGASRHWKNWIPGTTLAKAPSQWNGTLPLVKR
jgi:hypothetical protein